MLYLAILIIFFSRYFFCYIINYITEMYFFIKYIFTYSSLFALHNIARVIHLITHTYAR